LTIWISRYCPFFLLSHDVEPIWVISAVRIFILNHHYITPRLETFTSHCNIRQSCLKWWINALKFIFPDILSYQNFWYSILIVKTCIFIFILNCLECYVNFTLGLNYEIEKFSSRLVEAYRFKYIIEIRFTMWNVNTLKVYEKSVIRNDKYSVILLNLKNLIFNVRINTIPKLIILVVLSHIFTTPPWISDLQKSVLCLILCDQICC